jgi:SPP1 gp7 family putative phage head morphogenesis protein
VATATFQRSTTKPRKARPSAKRTRPFDAGDELDDDDEDDVNEDGDESQRHEIIVALALQRFRRSLIRGILATAGRNARLARLDERLAPSRIVVAIQTEIREAVRGLTAAKLDLLNVALDEQAEQIVLDSALALGEELARLDDVTLRRAIETDDDAAIRALLRQVAIDTENGVRLVGDRALLETLSSTAIHTAANQVLARAYTATGVEFIRWICDPNPCPICAPTNGVVRRAGDEFPSVGVAYPPTHPRCRCSTEPVLN